MADKDYYFFQLPMIVKAWQRIGFQPIVILVTQTYPVQDKLALQCIIYLIRFKAKLVYLISPPGYEVLLSMTSRIFIGLIDSQEGKYLQDDDFVVTSDSDLYPINKAYYLDNIMSSNYEQSIYLWNAFCCGEFMFENKSYSMFPIGHIGMTKKMWREVVLGDRDPQSLHMNSEFILNELKLFKKNESFFKTNSEIKKGDEVWYFDQIMISVLIQRFYEKNKDQVDLNKIVYTGLRLDRGMSFDLLITPDYETNGVFTDFHSFQEDIYTRIHSILKIFDKLFDLESIISIEKYTTSFLLIKNSIGNH